LEADVEDAVPKVDIDGVNFDDEEEVVAAVVEGSRFPNDFGFLQR